MAFQASTSMESFRNILSRLLSPDNDLRTEAEEVYEKLPALDKNYLLLNICNDDSIPQEEAELAAVLLRRLISSDFDEIYLKMAPDVQEQIKSLLLGRLQQNINSSLRKKISDIATELARNFIDENGTNHWQQYLSFLFDGACSSDPSLREIVLLMFASGPGVFGNQQCKYLNVICQMLSQTLADQQSIQVRYAAAKAFSAFMLANEKETHIHKMFVEAQCDIKILKLFDDSLNLKDAEPDEVLSSLMDLVEECPQFFRNQIDNLFELCWKGLANKENLDSTRQLSLEVFVSTCEAAPAMVRKCGSKHIPTNIMSTLEMMMELEEETGWDFVDDDNTDDEDNGNSTVAEAALDRLACSLGGKTILPLVMTAIQQMLSSGDWKHRYAALMAISAVGEGCIKQMIAILPKIVERVLPFLFDQNTRVRYAACNALGQMSTDFAPSFQKKFHEKVITSLLQLLSDPSSPRVQAHAGAALVNFFEDCPKNILSPYLNSIVPQIEAVLASKFTELAEKGTKIVLEQLVVTLASLADSAQEKFVEYYDKFMPCLKFIIENTNQPHLLMLRGKTIECVSLIGLAVGKEKFLPDANHIMELLLKSQAPDTPIADDDPQLSYMITAWARICKILGKGFEPYLQFVMGPVLKAASLRPEIAVLDADDMKVVGNDEEWEFVNIGEKHNFGIRTAGLEDKATACQMLVCYAKELKESFAPYVTEIVQLMVPLLKFYFHDGVRTAASEILPYLLESAKVQGESYLNDMWRFILPQLLQALESEPEAEVLCEHMAAFSQCIEVLNCNCLTEDDMAKLIKTLNKYLETHFKKSEERQNKRKDEDYDEASEEELLREDDEDMGVLSKLSEIVCTLFSTYKEEFFVCFEMLLPHFINLLDVKRSWQDRQWSLCVFADIIEYCGPACAKYQQYFLPSILSSVQDESPDLRQTAAYCVGVLAQNAGPTFAEFCAKDAFPILVQMINSQDSRSEENERATENAISSITKIFMSNNPSVNAEEIIPVWITWLPIWDDEQEVKYIYNVLCTLLESNSKCLLGNDNCNLPRIVYIFAETFLKEAIEPSSDVGKRICTLVKAIQSNGELFTACVSQLSPSQQEALRSALTQ